MTASLLFGGCVSAAVMTKNDMTSFDQDHYGCYMQSEQSYARPFINVGSILDAKIEKKKMYILCMKARGYKQE